MSPTLADGGSIISCRRTGNGLDQQHVISNGIKGSIAAGHAHYIMLSATRIRENFGR